MTEYERWLAQELEDPDLAKELREIKDNEAEINDRFYKDLTFGTGGLRGILGAGTNRMNLYTVRKATQGLANYLLRHKKENQDLSVAIAYDSRIKSDLFAQQTAAVLAANGIYVHFYRELMPTPALSFAVRYLHCDAGVCVTASHNPSSYNGYKAYGNDGCQIALEMADEVMQEINHTDIFTGVRCMDFNAALQSGWVTYIPDAVTTAFLDAVQARSVYDAKGGDLRVVYTPLNGTGRNCVLEILKRIGIADVTVVPEQEWPDGNFPTCPFPNPELREALQLGLELSEKLQPDLLLATDPDSDRCGIAVKHNGTFVLPNGNEIGILLFDFIASQREKNKTMPQNPLLISTIVSTDMTDPIAKHYGASVSRVYTGFKYIGDQIATLEENGEVERCIFSFEESNGYLCGTYVRDKDAVNACMLICEMALYHKRQGKTLIDVLEELYQKYGYYLSDQDNFFFEGEDGMLQMAAIMQQLRQNPPAEIAGIPVIGRSDYQTLQRWEGTVLTEIQMSSSNVLEYRLANGAKFLIRPSGTEPKVKAYYLVNSPSQETSLSMIETLKSGTRQMLKL